MTAQITNNNSTEERPKISIALCTFNGEKYLQEQLDSFTHQTILPFELVACDDCSQDSTTAILEEFSHNAPFPVRIFRNDRNLGLVNNFSQAAGLCEGEYIAFSDQDDIWLPDKLEACFHAMKKAEAEYGEHTPLLVYSDLCLIDNEKHIIASSFMRLRHIRYDEEDPLKTLLINNFVAGCTSLCNRALINESLPFPEVVHNHDGWIALIAASRGRIEFIPEAKVIYRQHPANVTGTTHSPYNIRALIKRLRDPARPEKIISSLRGLLFQAEELQKRLNDLSRDCPQFLSIFINALKKGGMMNALRLFILRKDLFQGLIPNLSFYFHIVRRSHLL